MRKTILRSLLLPLVAAAAITVPTGTAEHARVVGDAAASCQAATAARDARVAGLERTATRVERGVRTAAGTRADRYHFAMVPVSGPRAGGTIVYELAHFGEGHAGTFAESPAGYSAVTDRFYWYDANPSILHWISAPCGGSDQYAYDFGATCSRSLSSSKTNPVPNDCNWNLDASLQTSVDGGSTWSNSWGGVHYGQDRDVACASSGGQHSLADGFGQVRTWMRVQVDFLRDDGTFLFTSQPRKTTSYWMFTGSLHLTDGGPGVNEFLSSPTDPGFAGNNPC